jgi:putative transposase
MVKETVEETLNAMLDAEADRLIQAEKYERTDARKDTRAGHYKRKLDDNVQIISHFQKRH